MRCALEHNGGTIERIDMASEQGTSGCTLRDTIVVVRRTRAETWP